MSGFSFFGSRPSATPAAPFPVGAVQTLQNPLAASSNSSSRTLENPFAAASATSAAPAPSPSTNGRISPINSRSKKNEIIVANPLDTPVEKGKRLHQLIREYAYVFEPESHNPTKSPYDVQADIVSKALALIRENVDLNTKDNHGMTTLLNACRRGSEAIAMAILKKDDGSIDINAKGTDMFSNGSTPLIEACRHRLVPVALELIKRGANLNEQTTWSKMTALMVACEKSLLSVVTVLIDKGADVQLKNLDKQTALDITCYELQNDYTFSGGIFNKRNNYIAIAKLFLRMGLKSEGCNTIKELKPNPPPGPRPSAPGAGIDLPPRLGGKRRSKRTRHRKGKKPQRSRKNRR